MQEKNICPVCHIETLVLSTIDENVPCAECTTLFV